MSERGGVCGGAVRVTAAKKWSGGVSGWTASSVKRGVKVFLPGSVGMGFQENPEYWKLKKKRGRTALCDPAAQKMIVDLRKRSTTSESLLLLCSRSE